MNLSEKALFGEIKKARNGKVINYSPFSSLKRVFTIRAEQYILIGSISGVGKTSLIDHILLSTINGLNKDVNFEVLYYSMERKIKFKLAKWLSWRIYNRFKFRIDANQILGITQPVTEEEERKYRTFKPWLDNVLNHIDIREGTRSVEQIKKDIDKKAKQLGDYYWADDKFIYKFDKKLAPFPKKKFIDTKYGKRYYVEYGEYTLFQNDSVFITKKPTLFVILIDHIGKVKGEGNKKQILDSLDQVLADARDKYGFSPIAISQFNRAIGDTNRLKFSKGDLSPIMEDFKDTGNLVESADLVMSVFDPSKYNAWNSKGEYAGVNIRDGMVTPTGKHRARSIHILKNTYGTDKAKMVVRFTGEAGYFEEIDRNNLQKLYDEIAKEK